MIFSIEVANGLPKAQSPHHTIINIFHKSKSPMDDITGTSLEKYYKSFQAARIDNVNSHEELDQIIVSLKKNYNMSKKIISNAINKIYCKIVLSPTKIVYTKTNVQGMEITYGSLLYIYTLSFQKIYGQEDNKTRLHYNGKSKVRIYDRYIVCTFYCD